MARHPDVERRICLALVDAMAELHSVDVDAAGLRDLGKPDGFGARRVPAGTIAGVVPRPTIPSPTMNDVARARPRRFRYRRRVSVVHNDLKLDNCQFHADDPDHVTSVFDWDMATTGDPLFDVANLLSSSQQSPIWVVSRDDVAQRYAQRSGIDITNIKWYEAFASFRTGVVVQQLYNRYARGESTDERLASFGDLVPGIAERRQRSRPRITRSEPRVVTTAAVCTDLSGEGAIEVQDWAVPATGPGAVRIAVRAASVNFPDVLMARGLYQSRIRQTAVRRGDGMRRGDHRFRHDVSEFAVGDRVLGLVGSGAFASEVIATPPMQQVHRIPDEMPFAKLPRST